MLKIVRRLRRPSVVQLPQRPIAATRLPQRLGKVTRANGCVAIRKWRLGGDPPWRLLDPPHAGGTFPGFPVVRVCGPLSCRLARLLRPLCEREAVPRHIRLFEEARRFRQHGASSRGGQDAFVRLDGIKKLLTLLSQAIRNVDKLPENIMSKGAKRH